MAPLKTAVNDAEKITEILNKKYGFTVTLIRNGNHKNIVNELYKIRKQMNSSDNLLVYYAGHGELDEEENLGYWIPIDGDLELRSNWISTNYVLAQIKATKAKHVLVIVDSCFSGSLHRGNQNKSTTKDISKLAKKKTRISITSGGNEPVMDSGNDGHSVFAYSFIKNLNEKNTLFFSTNLFSDLRKYVLNNADQTPELSVLTKIGHDGGDFIFVPK